MQRRAFLKLFGAASVATVAGVAVLDPDALLWRLGAKLISVPCPRTTPEFAKIGDTIVIRRPARFIGRDGVSMALETLIADYEAYIWTPQGLVRSPWHL